MKTHIIILLTLIIALTALPMALAFDSVLTNAAADVPETGYKYIPGIGLTFGDSAGYALFGQGKDDPTPHYLPNPVVHFAPNQPFLVAVRLQQDYKTSAQDAKPAEFQWTRTDGLQAWNVNSALIVDMFSAEGLTPLNLFRYGNDSRKEYAFHWTFGADWQKESAGSKPEDFQTYFVGFELRPLGQDLMLVKAGAMYERDALSGKNDFSYTLRVDPVFAQQWLGVRVPFHNDALINAAEELINRDSKMGDPASQSVNTQTAKDSHSGLLMDGQGHAKSGSDSFFIKPHMDLKTSTGGDLKSVQDIGDLNFVYGVDTGLYLFAETLTLNYSFNGLQPLTSGGQAHNYHEVTLRWTPKLDPRNWSDFSVFATYTDGQAPPTFVKSQQIKVGLGIKL